MSLIERARLFATAAHGASGQVRKYTGEPYINNPIAVSNLVKSIPHTPEMVATLHAQARSAAHQPQIG